MINVGTEEQVAEIFTKPFADKSKWEHASKLINHARVTGKPQTGGKDSDAHVVSKPHLTAAASTPTSRPTGQAQDLALQLALGKDCDPALTKLPTTLVQDNVRFYSLGFRPGQDHHHLTKATLKLLAVTKYLNHCVVARATHNWTRLVIKTGHLTRNDDSSTEVYRCATTGETTVRMLSMNHPNLTSQEHQALQSFSFRTDGIASAASARTPRRPTDAQNRVIVEFCCGESSRLGENRKASKGCLTIRVTEKDDATKQSTIKRLCKDLCPLLCDKEGYQARSQPLLIWASLRCTGGCPWQHINILTNREKVEDHHKQFLKLLESLSSFIRIMKLFKPELAMELPKTCDYWKWTVVQAFIKRHRLQSCLCDGCMLGIVDVDGQPLCKSWQIMSTATKDAESTSYERTDAIHRDWKQQVARTTSKALPTKESFALSCLAGSNRTPVAVMASSADQNRAFWHEVMWAPSSQRNSRPDAETTNLSEPVSVSSLGFRMPV